MLHLDDRSSSAFNFIVFYTNICLGVVSHSCIPEMKPMWSKFLWFVFLFEFYSLIKYDTRIYFNCFVCGHACFVTKNANFEKVHGLLKRMLFSVSIG